MDSGRIALVALDTFLGRRSERVFRVGSQCSDCLGQDTEFLLAVTGKGKGEACHEYAVEAKAGIDGRPVNGNACECSAAAMCCC